MQTKLIYDRNVILCYLHVSKCGGTTVCTGLSKHFNENQFLKISQTGSDKAPRKKTLKKIEFATRPFYSLEHHEIRNLKLIDLQTERCILPTILGRQYFFLMNIRKPLERLQSLYYYSRKSTTKSKDYIKAAFENDINDWFLWMLDNSKSAPNVINPYSRCLVGADDFNLTKDFIDNKMYLASTNSQINEFSRVLTQSLFNEEEIFPPIRVNDENPKELEFNKKISELIVNLNQIDILLYHYIEKEFMKIITEQT